VGLPHLHLVFETAYPLVNDADTEKDRSLIKNRIGVWLVSRLNNDLGRKYWVQTVRVFADEIMKMV
jgi:hypothetical protein